MEGLLEIDSLSEQDRDIILQVLKRDDEVRKTQELKANQLKVEIQSLRMQSVLRPGDDLSKMCARCHGELGVIFNRGDICPKCRFRVCNHCKETTFKGSWLCNLCFKQRQLKLLTGEWAGGPSSGLKRWASGTDLVKASIIYKDHPPHGRKQDAINVKQSREQVLQRKQGVVSSSNDSGQRAIGGQEIRKSPAKAANNIEVQKEHTNGVVSAQETERVEYPKDTDKQRLSQLLNFIRAKKPPPAEAKENSREMSVRRITSRNDSESSESSSSSSETDDDIGSSYQQSLRSSSVSPPISEVDYDVQMSESARLQSVHEENIDIEGDGRNQVVKPAPLEQLTLESSDVNVPSRDISPKEKSKSILDHQKSNTKPDVSTEERHVNSSPSSSSGKSNACAKMSMITTSCEVHTSTQSDQSRLQLTAIQGDGEIQSRITSADLPLGRSSSPISVSMDSLSSSHPSPSMSRSNTADMLEKGSIHDASDTESVSRASQPEITESTESVVQEGSADDDYVLEEISKVKFRRISQPSRHSEGQGPRLSHSPQRQKRTSPMERSESSASQEDSGHVSLPASVDHTPEHKRTDSGYSQSSIPSTRSTATDRSEEEDIDTLVASAKSNMGSRGNLLSVIADSRESIVSYYSDAGDISHSNIPVTGEVLFGLNYNYKTGMLEIAVKQCKDIAPADTKRKRSDPYVKTYLLPDKTRSGKRKTKVKKRTLSPIFDEVLKYSVSKSELENRTLWLSVWHNDRFGRNDFLGEVTINFDYYKFDDPTPKWYPLQERMDSQQPSMLTYKGDLILSICFVTTADNRKGQQNVDSSKGQLHVMIKEAHNLTAVKSNGYSDPFCKGYLLPERHRSSKQKTPVVKKNCNPVWNYKMVFEDMTRAELAERCLELTIWDHEKLASNDFLGGVRLNLGTGLYQGKLVDWMDSKGEEISLWQAVLDRPNLWIDSTLILRPNMQKRKF